MISFFNCCIGGQEIEQHSGFARQTEPDGHSAQRAKDLEEGGNRAHRCQEKDPLKVKPTRGVGRQEWPERSLLSRQDDPSERGHQGDRGQERTKAVPHSVVGGGQAPKNSSEALPRPSLVMLGDFPGWGTSDTPFSSQKVTELSSGARRPYRSGRNLENSSLGLEDHGVCCELWERIWLEGTLQPRQPGEQLSW